MGVSTDAIIAFGVDYGEEHPVGIARNQQDSLELSEHVAIQMLGAVDPFNAEGDVDGRPPGTDYNEWRRDTPEGQAHGRKVKEWSKLTSEAKDISPIVIDYHCSYEYPMHIVAIKGTITQAWRGDPVELTLPFPEISERQVAECREFCRTIGIEGWDEPKWLLYSMWG